MTQKNPLYYHKLSKRYAPYRDMKELFGQGLNKKQIRVIMGLRGYAIIPGTMYAAQRDTEAQYKRDIIRFENSKPTNSELRHLEKSDRDISRPISPRTKHLLAKFGGKVFY